MHSSPTADHVARLIVTMLATPFQVSDKTMAAVFYGEGLGLTADPGSTAAQRGGVGVTWYNIGRQQVPKAAIALSSYTAFSSARCSVSSSASLLVA